MTCEELACEELACEELAWAAAEGRLDAGSTPSKPCPVPWLAGCGGISARVISALDTTEFDVSATSVRTGGIVLVIGGPGWEGAAEASLTGPALTWTVLTRTGFIGSDEPGMAGMAWAW